MSGGETGPNEVEFKRRIPDREAFERLLAAAGGHREPAVEQHNHFFDTPSRALASRRIAFRLRREGDRAIATLKGPAQGAEAGGPSVREEVEWDVAAELASRVLAGDDDASSLLPDRGPVDASSLAAVLREAARSEPLDPAGWFGNERTRVAVALAPGADEPAIDAVLEFDETHFPGGRVDFELELEIDDPASAAVTRRALDALLERAGIAAVDCPSKLARLRAIEAARSDER